MKERILKNLACLIALWLIPLLVHAEGRFTQYYFKLKGQVTDVINEDLDNDGLLDLLAIHIDRAADPPARYLSILFQDKDNGFEEHRKIEWLLPRDVAALDVGDVSPAPGREVVAITEKGVSYATIAHGRVSGLAPLLEAQSMVAIPSEQEIPYYNFVWDYTGDGRDDILVCGFYDALLARHNGDYRFHTQRLNIRPTIDIIAFDLSALMVTPEHPVFRAAYWAPQVYAHDYNADGLLDLIVCFRYAVHIFPQGPQGFAPEPVKRYKIKLFNDDPQRRAIPPTFDFEDIDQDGRVDIVAYQMQGQIGSMKSRSVLYWGKSDKVEKGQPDLEFNTDYTVMGKVIIWDVNHDGLHDLIMPTYHLSAWNIGKILVTGEITVVWDYFLQRQDHTFPQLPDRKITTNMKVNLRNLQLESGIPNVVADFNGDGYPDQALGESENLLVITLRDAAGNPLPPEERVNVPVPIFYRAVDLNQDKRSDIVMYYLEDDAHRGDLRILLNNGPW